MPYMPGESGLTDALVAHGYDGAVIENLIARGASTGDLLPLLELQPKDMAAGLAAVTNRFPAQVVPEFYAAQSAARSSSLPSWLPIAAVLFAGYWLFRKRGK
jgi:hypothetical protein